MADEEKEPAPIPYYRFAEVNRQLADAKRALEETTAKHNDALKEYEIRVKHAEKRVSQFQTDHEAAVKRATELEQAVEAERLGSAFAGLGLTDPDLRDFVRGKYLAVAPDEKGARPPVDKWFSEYAKEKPYLQPSTTTQKPASLNKGAGDPPPMKGTVADIANMPPDQWKAFKQAGGRLT
jgi:hypothetical protein